MQQHNKYSMTVVKINAIINLTHYPRVVVAREMVLCFRAVVYFMYTRIHWEQRQCRIAQAELKEVSKLNKSTQQFP